jgi:hypothetical protein
MRPSAFRRVLSILRREVEHSQRTPIPWPKRICIDFDGVIHSCTSPWEAPEIIPDPPVPGAFDYIEEYLRAGYRVAVFSSRSSKREGQRAMYEWFMAHGMPPQTLEYLEFPNHKPAAEIYIDDRGFCFRGIFPSVDFVNNFKPWNK